MKRLLIANRGEIACRIQRTCRELGIETVAVYSDADRDLPHVRNADLALRLGPAPAADSYLRIDRLLQAARDSGAEAIHPGYGFLSENADFAQAVLDAGLIWIGPPPQAIRLMGDKSAARLRMAEHGVPVLPGHDRDERDPSAWQAAAEQVGFPLLIKAVAGGGGKGMRVVERAEDVVAALEAARREARAAFGDDRVLLERYLPRARHVEVQVFADRHGAAVYLFERDCSVQRRHQKVVEEAPAPGLSEATRQRLGEAAVQAARAVDYEGAGTVEFLLAPDQSFFFMEMNTRLQVEHPVTEMITGEDLVAWQLQVAAGRPLPREQDRLRRQGHAIEVRIYAEDPSRQFLPSSGVLHRCDWPEGEHVRVDTGYHAGLTVSDHYDPMLGKIIAWGEDRDTARQRLREALARTRLGGIRHNLGALRAILGHPAFAAADLSTRFLEDHQPALTLPDHDRPRRAALVACLWRARPSACSADPWSRRDGWRNVEEPVFALTLADPDGQPCRVLLYGSADAPRAVVNGTMLAPARFWAGEGRWLDSRGPLQGLLDDDGRLYLDGHTEHWTLNPDLGQTEEQQGGLQAPMNGRIVAHCVQTGDRVEKGQPLITLEAMKMEQTLHAPASGLVRALPCAVGALVSEGTLLVDLEEDTP